MYIFTLGKYTKKRNKQVRKEGRRIYSYLKDKKNKIKFDFYKLLFISYS